MSRDSHPRETTNAHDRSSCADGNVAVATRDEIAGLLAVAYRRLKAITQVGAGQDHTHDKYALANTPAQSVHGVVP